MQGKFEFRGGSPGTVTLRASRDSFKTQARAVTWGDTTVTGKSGYDVVFNLESIEPPIGLEPGPYTLTVAADVANGSGWPARPDAPCAGFPTELASRSYRAEIRAATPGSSVRSVTADDPTLRWRDLFTFYILGSYVAFAMEGGVGAGLYEALPGFRHLEIGGFSKYGEPAVREGSSISVTFEGAISYCQLKSARGVNEECYQAPRDEIVEFHVCISNRHRLTFISR